MSKKKEQEKKTRKASRRQIEQLAAQIADEMAVGLFGRTEEYAANVGRYYSIAVDELLKLSARVELDPESEVFSFSDNKRMSEKSNAILRGLYSAVYQEIRSGVIREWENANAARDRLVELVMGKGARDDKRFASLFARNREAMEAFFRRKNEYGGLNLSQKVWKYTGQFKDEMELALSVSLGRGDSAATVSRKVRQYLQEPDRLFRRVRDEKGNLKLSKRAAAYHPGPGQYRSSYKNAMRLTRTETNMAYRSADYERRQRHPWIVGVEVKRVHDKTDCPLCDALKGKYPKDFKFVGWHPQCRCYTLDILAKDEEVDAYNRAMLNGEDVSSWQFSGQITELPDSMKQWLSDNADRVEKAAERDTLPYWIKDNPKYVGVKQVAQPEPIKDIHDQRDTMSPELRVRMDLHNERVREFKRLVDDPNYENVAFNEDTLGLKANHIDHNFDKRGGAYEKHARDAGYNAGHAVILESEFGTTIGERFTEGTWDGMKFEVAGRETATSNNILRGLKHCAEKRETEVAVLDFPNGGFNIETLKNAIKRYKGLEPLNDGQYLKFKKIICVENERIVYEADF